MTAPRPEQLEAACLALADQDQALAEAYRCIGVPTWRVAVAEYETLARAVTYQLLSTKAAGAIWARTKALFAGTCSVEAMLNADIEDLRACGLSRPKIQHMRSIAEAIESGALDFAHLAMADLREARASLLNVKGIGPWTADLFLMSAFGRLDAFPKGDVGVMEAYRQISGAETRHETKEFNALAENWRPYRGVATHLLWSWLNARRDAKVAPL